MTAFYLDTSYLLALELKRDQNHRSAQAHWKKLEKSSPRLVTTSYVFDEFVTFLSARGHRERAIQAGNFLLQSPSTQVMQVDEPLFWKGWQSFQKHADKSYSLTDCISFAAMDELGIQTALTFDQHFESFGFSKEP